MGLANPGVLYLDLYAGEVDHQGHATNQPAALDEVLTHLDSVAGRIWSIIQAGPLAKETLLVVVSDHGMNNVPGIFSQAFSLPDLLSTPLGGAHHVITNRHQLSDFKLKGLDPLVERVITPSTASFYLAGEAQHYPTAWLDLDGNERASVHLRNSDLNKIHVLLQQLSRPDLNVKIRRAAATCLMKTIARNRDSWATTIEELDEELAALKREIETRKQARQAGSKRWSRDEKSQGLDKAARRQSEQLEKWQTELDEYQSYLAHLRALLSIDFDSEHAFNKKVSDYVPEMSLGENNDVFQLQHYVAGPAADGLVLSERGDLDEERSFRHIDYFSLLVSQRVRNNPQPALSSRPVDFVAMRLPADAAAEAGAKNVYWLYGDEDKQLLILQNDAGEITLRPIKRLCQEETGHISWISAPWTPTLPLQLFEDPELKIHGDRALWLSSWHSERDWFAAIHKCRYSNGVIGVTEQFSPISDNVPGPPNTSPLLLRYERRLRQLVQPDFQVFAADHWNFNARNFNPGGNHGSFLRISTHSVWMMAGAGVPVRSIDTPYDSLNFASTVLDLLGKPAPMPDRIVNLQAQ